MCICSGSEQVVIIARHFVAEYCLKWFTISPNGSKFVRLVLIHQLFFWSTIVIDEFDQPPFTEVRQLLAVELQLSKIVVVSEISSPLHNSLWWFCELYRSMSSHEPFYMNVCIRIIYLICLRILDLPMFPLYACPKATKMSFLLS